MNTNTEIKKESFYYDYKTVDTSQQFAPEIVDCYEALGWTLSSRNESITGNITIGFRRDRKIKHKEQLNRLQLRLDDYLNSIKFMEKKKTSSAIAGASILGVIGTLFFGGGMSIFLVEFTKELWHYIAGGIFAFIGISICLLGYRFYTKIKDKKTKALTVQIEKRRDEIANLCEEAALIFQNN